MRHVETDYYEILAVDPEAPTADIRKAFRGRLLELHPDKVAEPSDADVLGSVIEAFEILGNPELRRDYDRHRLWRSSDASTDDLPRPKTPHVTESDRPVDQARAILFLLLRERGGEALQRLRALEEEPLKFLSKHLEHEELVDVSFLLGEVYEKQRQPVIALQWYQIVLLRERHRRQPRPCHAEAVTRVKRLLLQQAAPPQEPRVALQYLRRAEALGMTRSERAEILRRRAQCYLLLEMRVTAGESLREALRLQPQIKGASKLRSALRNYL
ncbi:MAG: DnaJ domain-containing protein [Pseudomonadota bacterium]